MEPFEREFCFRPRRGPAPPKWSGDNDSALTVLKTEDWDGSIRDLRLAVAVVEEKYDNAADLMRKIGKEGELVRDFGYAKWPIFREFRKSPQFLKAYHDIYGIEFADRSPTGSSPNQNDRGLIPRQSVEPEPNQSPQSDGEPVMPTKPLDDNIEEENPDYIRLDDDGDEEELDGEVR